MNYDQPRQIKAGENTGKWHYTTHNRRLGTAPIGYCANDCPGHGTAEEARDHYRQYMLDKRLRFYPEPEDPIAKYRCEAVGGCGNYTAAHAELGAWHHWFLCDEHRTRAEVEKLYPEAGDSMHS